MGFSTGTAIKEEIRFIAGATMKTARLLPVAAVSMLDYGTTSDAVPLEAYCMSAFVAARLGPKVSPPVAGNRL
jgi:hypothetical protein